MKKIIPPAVIGLGIAVGVVMALCGWWNFFEPVIGVSTLAVAALGWFRSVALGKKLGAIEQKKFELNIGLRAGYDADAQVFSPADAEQAIREWMETRQTAGFPVLTGMVQLCTLLYPVRNGENGSRVTSEPSVVFSGALSPKYDRGRSDAEVTDTLNSLAQFVGERLRQKRVYASFTGKQWAIDI